jgi:hypothetical protein
MENWSNLHQIIGKMKLTGEGLFAIVEVEDSILNFRRHQILWIRYLGKCLCIVNSDLIITRKINTLILDENVFKVFMLHPIISLSIGLEHSRKCSGVATFDHREGIVLNVNQTDETGITVAKKIYSFKLPVFIDSCVAMGGSHNIGFTLFYNLN